MKKIIPLLLIIHFSLLAQSQNVQFNDVHFFNFLMSLNIDQDKNGTISYAEAQAVKRMDISDPNSFISDLTGIEAFTNLEELWCTNQKLTSLVLTSNSKLKRVECEHNSISNLNLSNNLNLYYLDCSFNNISNLDIRDDINLDYVDCGMNNLKTLDVSKNINLKILICAYNPLKSIDVSKNRLLEALYTHSDPITKLDLSNNLNLNTLGCDSNKLDSLNICKNTNLAFLQIGFNPFVYLDLSNCKKLTYIELRYCYNLRKLCVWELPFPPKGVNLNLMGLNADSIEFVLGGTTVHDLPLSSNQKPVIYPNPSNGLFFIHCKDLQKLEVLNLSGNLLLSQDKLHEIDLTNYPEGIYLLKAYSKNELFINKITIK